MHGDLALLGAVSPANLLHTLGVLGVLLILFAETGLLVGFFLPGDSLLFVAGYATVHNNALPHDLHYSLGAVLLVSIVGAIVGAQVGYLIGLRAGPALFRRPDARLFKHAYVERAENAFGRFGPSRALVIARFVPIVRTFINPLAGAVRMPARDFTLWNVIGGLLWAVSLVLLGHFVGNVHVIRSHIEALTLLVVLISVAPLLFHIGRDAHRARSAGDAS